MCASQSKNEVPEQGNSRKKTPNEVSVDTVPCIRCKIGAHRDCKNPVPLTSGGARCCDWGLDWLE